VTDDVPEALISTGEFARRSRLSVKALRIYDRLGLLRPAKINQANGYRRYSPSQVRTGQLIGLLRGAALSLPDISRVMADLAVGGQVAVEHLDRLLTDIDQQHADRKLLIRHIQPTLREGIDLMFPINTRHVAAQRVMSVQRRLHAPETDRFLTETRALFTSHLAGAKPTGPFTLIFHGIVDYENDGPLEAILGCPADIEPTEAIGIRTEPAHDEAYTTITKAQWAYPAILAAYDAVACSLEATTRPGNRLSCREVYLAEPDTINDDDPICDIAFPVGVGLTTRVGERQAPVDPGLTSGSGTA
jgi:DNA-binding transcriptional MerR regulator